MITFKDLGFRQKQYADKNYFEYEKKFTDDVGNEFLHHIIIDGEKNEVACYDSTLDDGFTCGSNLTFEEVLVAGNTINALNQINYPELKRPRIFAKG